LRQKLKELLKVNFEIMGYFLETASIIFWGEELFMAPPP
jgi:hypothetical protein